MRFRPMVSKLSEGDRPCEELNVADVVQHKIDGVSPPQADSVRLSATVFLGEQGDRFGQSPQANGGLPAKARAFLDDLLRLRLVTPHSVAQFLGEHADFLHSYADPETLAAELIHRDLLTDYQLNRVVSGKTHGLVVGNHKILRRLGA